MKKKALALILTAGLLLTGCGSGQSTTNNTGNNQGSTTTDNSSGGKAEVTVWCWDPLFNIAIMEEAAKIYEADHEDVDIKVVEIGGDEIEQKLNIAFTSGATNGLPDITLIQDFSSAKFIESYDNAFVDLSDKIDFSNFAQYKVDTVSRDGATYAVPFDSGVVGMFYRKDILEEAGYTSEDLQDITWDDFINIGKDVKEKTGSYMIGNNTESYYKDLLTMAAQSAGQWIYGDDGKIDIANSTAFKEILRIIKEMEDTGIIKATDGWSNWVGSMNDGSVATVITGVWITASIKAATDQSGKWGVVPFPKLNIDGGTHYTNQGGSSWYVLESSKNQEIAVDFLKTVYAGNDDFYQYILENQGAIGSYLPAHSGSAYTAPQEFFDGQAVFADFSDWMSKVQGVDFGESFGECRDEIFKYLPDFISGKMTADDVLSKANSDLANMGN